MRPDELVLVLSNWPDLDQARRAARTVVDERLVACANILPGVESIYHWKGDVESSSEVTIVFKTARACYGALERRLKELHPYEVPEILSFSAADGLPAYLGWVEEAVGTPGHTPDAEKKR